MLRRVKVGGKKKKNVEWSRASIYVDIYIPTYLHTYVTEEMNEGVKVPFYVTNKPSWGYKLCKVEIGSLLCISIKTVGEWRKVDIIEWEREMEENNWKKILIETRLFFTLGFRQFCIFSQNRRRLHFQFFSSSILWYFIYTSLPSPFLCVNYIYIRRHPTSRFVLKKMEKMAGWNSRCDAIVIRNISDYLFFPYALSLNRIFYRYLTFTMILSWMFYHNMNRHSVFISKSQLFVPINNFCHHDDNGVHLLHAAIELCTVYLSVSLFRSINLLVRWCPFTFSFLSATCDESINLEWHTDRAWRESMAKK